MADKVKAEYTLNIECMFVDGDTRTIKLKNPKSTITTEEITALEALIKNEVGGVQNSLLIGDKAAADFKRINTVTKISTTTTTLDISF